jgi:hypothetical protein
MVAYAPLRRPVALGRSRDGGGWSGRAGAFAEDEDDTADGTPADAAAGPGPMGSAGREEIGRAVSEEDRRRGRGSLVSLAL